MVEEKQYKTKYVLSAVAGALSAYDLPDLVTTLPTAKLLLINPVDASGKAVGSEKAQLIYRSSKESLNIRHDVKPDAYVAEIKAWMR